MKYFTLFTLLSISLVGELYAQQNIGIGTTSPDSSAVLDITSTDKGVLIPRMDSTQREGILSPATGLMTYDSTTQSFWYYDSTWQEIAVSTSLQDIRSFVDSLPPDNFDCAYQVGKVADAGAGFDGYVLNDHLFFWDPASYMLKVFDLSNPEIPQQVYCGNPFGSFTPFYMRFSGNYAGAVYLDSNNIITLGLIDLSNPEAPQLASATSLPAIEEVNNPPLSLNDSMAIVQGFRQVNANNYDNYFIFIDVSDPTDPVIINNYNNDDHGGPFVVYGDHLYFKDSGLRILDISDPMSPVVLPFFLNQPNLFEMKVHNGHLYFEKFASQELYIYDLSDPEQPVLAGSYDLNATPGPYIFNDNYLFISAAGKRELHIVDIQDPTAPTAARIIELGEEPLLLFDISDGYLYGSSYSSGYNLDIISLKPCNLNISYNPGSGTLQATQQFWQGYDGNIAHGGGNVGINTTTPISTLHLVGDLRIGSSVNSSYVFPVDDGGSGKLMKTDGNGTLSWSNDNDKQTIDLLNLSGKTLRLSLSNDGMNPQTLNLSSINSDDQTLSLSGNNLGISSGNTIDISSIDTDEQSLSLSGNDLSISSGNTIDISSIDTDEQTLSLSGNDLSISEGNSVDLSSVNTDAQTLTLTGDSLAISTGNTIDLSTVNKIQPLIADTDNNTKIQVEETANEDRIHFDIGGVEYFVMDSARLQVLHSGHSVFMGEGAGANDDLSDNRNIFIGYRTGQKVTGGAQNVALGYYALANNELGVENTAIGSGALAATLGNRNTVLGWYALGLCPGGSDNVVIGRGAMDLVTTNVTNNVVIGTNAGYASPGNNNVLIGNDVGQGVSESHRLMIDNSNTNDPLIYGEFDNDLLMINGTLNINQAYSLPDTDGAQGQYLMTDGSGLASWVTNSTLHDNDGDTKIQVEESANENVVRFDVAGTEVLTLTDTVSTFRGTGRDLLKIKTLNNLEETGLAFQNAGSSYTWSIHRSAANVPDLVFSGGNTPFDVDDLTERMRITAQGNVLIAGDLTTGNLGADTLTAGYIKGYAKMDSASITGNVSGGSVTVSDSITIGASGTPLHSMIVQTVSEEVPFLPSNAEIFIDFTIPGATVNSVVHISPADELPDGIVIGQAYVSASDTVSVKFVNYETSAELAFTLDYRIAVINF